jgi:EpsI family protein
MPIHPAGVKNGEIRVNKALLQRGQQYTIVLYWFKMKEDFISSYKLLQLRFYLNRLSLRAPSSAALIEVYSPIINADEKAATAKVKAFAEELIPSLSQHLP